MHCRVCDCAEGVSETNVRLSETMFGTGEAFDYFKCPACGCLQISSPPTDMSTYYPDNYYSFSPSSHGLGASMKSWLRTYLALNGPSALFQGRDWYERADLKSLRDAKVTTSMKILDVGCGSGVLIADLKDVGFQHVIGVDPFISKNIVHKNGAQVLKCESDEITDQFDLVMMHHSLEHVLDQQKAAREINRLLVPGGQCIIRIPTIDCYAWEEYGTDWVQLDAPRHFYLHTRASITNMLEKTGLEVTSIVDDSGPFHLVGSEMIRLGHPLVDPNTNQIDFEATVPATFIATAAARAKDLNKRGRGDAIAVHARKS